MLAILLLLSIAPPCTASPELLLDKPAYLVAASCSSSGAGSVVVVSVQNRHQRERVEALHFSLRGSVARVIAPPGWSVSQEDSPIKREVIITWRASREASVKPGRSTGGFTVYLQGPSTFGCHRGIAFTVPESGGEVPGEMQGCLE